PESRPANDARSSSVDTQPDLRAELRIISIPVTDDVEELGVFSRMGLPLDVFASITTSEESIVSKVTSKATLMTITKGPDTRSSSVMLAVSRDDVEALILIRDLVRRRLASFYLAAGPRSGAPTASKEKSLQLRQMLSRLGYDLQERRPAAPPVV